MGRLADVVAAVGRAPLELGQIAVGIAHTLRGTTRHVVRGEFSRTAVVDQLYEIGNRSFLFIGVTLGFLGMILVYQAAYQAMQITGDLQLLGALFLQLLWREFAPTITALMLATRVGTGMAAELGSMVVTEQVDALRMSAARPLAYLVAPRLIASVIMGVALTIVAVAWSFLAGAATAHLAFAVNLRTFFDFSYVGPFDVIIGLTKALAYGVAIPVIACHAGLEVHGGSAGVGRATTQAVVRASLAVVVIDFIISGVGFVILSAIE